MAPLIRRAHAVRRVTRRDVSAATVDAIVQLADVVELSDAVEVGSSNSSPSTGRLRWTRRSSSCCSGRSSGTPARADEQIELLLHAVEARLHLLDRLGVLAPLLAELADQREDLVARPLDHEVVERLADDAEEGEQRQRRAHHDALGHGVVEQAGIVLVDEAGELLVGQEQQDVVDRRAGRPRGRTRAGPAPSPGRARR